MGDHGRFSTTDGMADRRLDRRAVLRAGAAGAAGLAVAALPGAGAVVRAGASQAGGCSGDEVELT